MPIYEYQCNNCGHHLETIQKMSDDPLTDCPECDTSSLRKLVSAAAFKLKGTGWYETDFKDKNKHKADGASGTDTSKQTGDTDKKAESAREVKKETPAKVESSAD